MQRARLSQQAQREKETRERQQRIEENLIQLRDVAESRRIKWKLTKSTL